MRAEGHPLRAAAMTMRSAFGDDEVSPRSPEIKVAVPPNLVGRGDHRAVLYFRKRLHYRSSLLDEPVYLMVRQITLRYHRSASN